MQSDQTQQQPIVTAAQPAPSLESAPLPLALPPKKPRTLLLAMALIAIIGAAGFTFAYSNFSTAHKSTTDMKEEAPRMFPTKPVEPSPSIAPEVTKDPDESINSDIESSENEDTAALQNEAGSL